MIMITRETGRIELRRGMIKIEIERKGIRRTPEGVELTGMKGIVIGIGRGIEKIEVKGIGIGRGVGDIWMRDGIGIVIETIERIEEGERGLVMTGGTETEEMTGEETTGEGTRGRVVEVRGNMAEKGVKIDGKEVEKGVVRGLERVKRTRETGGIRMTVGMIFLEMLRIRLKMRSQKMRTEMMIIKGIGRNMKVIVVGIDIIVDLAVLEGTGKKEREEKVTQQEGDLVDMAIIAGVGVLEERGMIGLAIQVIIIRY
mmetsp:Transcript_11871/g.11533  ORF Transcript_11871/g.11533 Transcript_11871/m.11533 type:complete len:256 (+) Transcript_11871:1137-1904(+)